MTVSNENVRSILPQLYEHLKPQPSVIRDRYRQNLNGPSTRASTTATADAEYEECETDIQEINFTGTATGAVTRPGGQVPVPEHRNGIQSGLE